MGRRSAEPCPPVAATRLRRRPVHFATGGGALVLGLDGRWYYGGRLGRVLIHRTRLGAIRRFSQGANRRARPWGSSSSPNGRPCNNRPLLKAS